jgi:hypothetical protein
MEKIPIELYKNQTRQNEVFLLSEKTIEKYERTRKKREKKKD